jgi:large subunit ribosomal protein L9
MKLIKLLLTENVDNLGIVGDVVNVRPGYARNFLLPRQLATKPTEGAVKRLAERRAVVEKEMQEYRVKLEALLEKVKGVELTLQRSANEQGILFGGVSQHDISQALQAEGFDIDDRAVRIGAQIKRLDSYTIPIVLAKDLKTEIKLWVVSDKPSEKLETERAKPSAEEGQAAGEGESAAHKPARKPKHKDAEGADEKPAQKHAESATEESAKPGAEGKGKPKGQRKGDEKRAPKSSKKAAAEAGESKEA